MSCVSGLAQDELADPATSAIVPWPCDCASGGVAEDELLVAPRRCDKRDVHIQQYRVH